MLLLRLTAREPTAHGGPRRRGAHRRPRARHRRHAALARHTPRLESPALDPRGVDTVGAIAARRSGW
ncbi:hypothetical protein [Nocardia abscessus]|uniref:hypothetical protein n=1 Tax=Nocardia abscessus TaxID=120957 RepID=UPI0024567026|nr:hypothetical protein [Nocardia abscessus]